MAPEPIKTTTRKPAGFVAAAPRKARPVAPPITDEPTVSIAAIRPPRRITRMGKVNPGIGAHTLPRDPAPPLTVGRIEFNPAAPKTLAVDGVLSREELKAQIKPKWLLAPIIAGRPQPVEVIEASREAWMIKAVAELTPLLVAVGETVPAVRVSFGWPGGRGKKVDVRGQCWMAETVEDGKPAIFITPNQHDERVILAILLHELVHASGHRNHKGSFAKVGAKLGLTAPFTSATPNEELAGKLEALAIKLGPLNHSRVNGGNPNGGAGQRVQTTRMLKVQCGSCGYTVRTTQKWLDIGIPTCPDGDCRDIGQEMAVEKRA